MNFVTDNSSQLGITNISYTPTYSNLNNPSILFSDFSSGIYNPSANNIIIYT